MAMVTSLRSEHQHIGCNLVNLFALMFALIEHRSVYLFALRRHHEDVVVKARLLDQSELKSKNRDGGGGDIDETEKQAHNK